MSHGHFVPRPVGQPGGRPPAPGELAIVQAFVNTANEELADDLLGTPGEATAWLRTHGLLGDADTLSAAERRRAVALREALRALLRHNNGAPLDPEAARTADATARRARVALSMDDGGGVVLTADALGRLLLIVQRAQTTGEWVRLKACAQCAWAYYDGSRNRSSRWCSMQVCGGRVKRRAYRARRS